MFLFAGFPFILDGILFGSLRLIITLLIFLILGMVACGKFTVYLAKLNHLPEKNWFWIGFFGSVWTIVLVAFANYIGPSKKSFSKEKKDTPVPEPAAYKAPEPATAPITPAANKAAETPETPASQPIVTPVSQPVEQTATASEPAIIPVTPAENQATEIPAAPASVSSAPVTQTSQPVEQTTSTPAPETATANSEVYCFNCRTVLKPGVKFCGYCGKKQQIQENISTARFCSVCGKPVNPEKTFCPYCGSKK